MKLYNIKTNLGYLHGFSEDTFNVQLGCAYQNAGLNKPIFSENKTEYTTRGLPSIITSLTNLIKEDLINITYINIEVCQKEKT